MQDFAVPACIKIFPGENSPGPFKCAMPIKMKTRGSQVQILPWTSNISGWSCSCIVVHRLRMQYI